MKDFKIFSPLPGIVCLVFLVLHLAGTPLNASATAAELEKLNVSYSSIAAASVSTWVPWEAGIYKKYGLDVNILYVAGSKAISAVISGDTPISQGSGAAAILARLSGSDVTLIGAIINVIPMSLVTTPDITGPQDVKGKTFGVTRFGSLTDQGLRRAISEWGLDPAKDIKIIQTGGVPENLLFMQQGHIKGALISSPTLEKAKEMGYRELVNLADIKFRYPSTALITTDSFIKSRPQTLKTFLKATLEGIKYAKTNRDFTIKILGKYTRTSDAKLLGSAFQSYVLGYIRNVPTITATEIESALEEIAVRNPKAKGAEPKQFFDPAPLDQLAKEGFIKQLHP
ncbi:MAG: ABC transporter substrate-binding protein [Candidatus Tectomicrobia bacterium]|uniref:ABC transporter substrate-binding protein n=1 Tax=Tectimicrobiota bacterium TaxID=2528274 RepID=A0A932GRZ1_UNCTE|nr:ABC transporter substrate-binding protein [Candidatus Tectomicrobia bacterium]